MIDRHSLRRAVFLDRDGVLNHNVFYPDTGAWESPRQPHEFVLTAGALPALRALADAGFSLFLVSNQPNVVNGKSTAAALAAMHRELLDALKAVPVEFAGFFYCTHHPRVTGPCPCRKPSPYFLRHAAQQHGLALGGSWMIGDRATDMACGRAAGTRTVWIDTGQERERPSPGQVDHTCPDLPRAISTILAAQSAPYEAAAEFSGCAAGKGSGSG